mmetsp:Transcript_100688/g.324899  ORF Transcript_100688/g.324899 Transcript_100688/m.324899 type:complete len:230 (-) Transcript_100688:93-782(-)
MGDEENAGPKPNKANKDDEFLRHPHSGAFVRNPFLDKSRSVPILFQVGEFDHNCLEEALADYHCIKVSESSLKNMTGAAPMTPASPQSTLQRAALGRLRDLPTGYEFIVTLKRSTYQPPKHSRRRAIEAKTATGVMVDKVNVEVSDLNGAVLRLEAVNEGLVAVWNRTHPVFQVKSGDLFVRVNDKRDAQGMLEELSSNENLKVTVRRAPQERRDSKISVASAALAETK